MFGTAAIAVLDLLQCFDAMHLQARWQQLHTFLRHEGALDPLARASTMALQQRCITRLAALANTLPVRDQRFAQHPATPDTLQGPAAQRRLPMFGGFGQQASMMCSQLMPILSCRPCAE